MRGLPIPPIPLRPGPECPHLALTLAQAATRSLQVTPSCLLLHKCGVNISHTAGIRGPKHRPKVEGRCNLPSCWESRHTLNPSSVQPPPSPRKPPPPCPASALLLEPWAGPRPFSCWHPWGPTRRHRLGAVCDHPHRDPTSDSDTPKEGHCPLQPVRHQCPQHPGPGQPLQGLPATSPLHSAPGPRCLQLRASGSARSTPSHSSVLPALPCPPVHTAVRWRLVQPPGVKDSSLALRAGPRGHGAQHFHLCLRDPFSP